jgi:hypothetical protein
MNYDYYFVYMINLTRQAVKVIIVTSALSFGLTAGALAQDPGARRLAAAPPPQAVSANSHQERTTIMQTARLSPEVQIPPLDTAVPARTETATFGLG